MVFRVLRTMLRMIGPRSPLKVKGAKSQLKVEGQEETRSSAEGQEF
jgi:hypothetical protein